MNKKDYYLPSDTTSIIAHQKAMSDALFLSIGEGAIATDMDGKISRVNQAALEMLGFTERDLLGKWFPEALIMADESGTKIPKIDRPITRAFISGRTIYERTYYRKKDGSLLPVAITVSPILLNDRPMGAIEVFRDITEELEVDRMKSEFISLASHQLRTPATAVKTYIGMLMDGFGGELSKDQMKLAKTAYESNDRQLSIINDLLFIANTESRSLKLKKERTNLCSLVMEVIEQQLDVIKKRGQQLDVSLPDQGVHHEVDPSLFKIVIDNLLSNASKYTSEGGKLELELARQNQCVELSVSDTGVGIDAGDLDKLFKKFTRIDNPLSTQVGGSGIGLYLLKQIVDLHRGDIVVESEKDSGTTFTVKLPA
jgi:PAS domain S-box-containing protein